MASYLNPQPSNAILDDITNIRELENYNAQSDPSLGSNFPVGAKRFVNIGTATAPKWQWQRYDGTSWKVMANTTTDKLMHNVDMLDGYHASTSAVANTIPVYNANKLLVGGITGNAATATKLATARNFQVGGIASGDVKSFNGTAAVTLPINSINVNNADDDAIVGVLTTAHGGTGRTDGAAQDVRVNSSAGATSAIATGQIGRAAIISSGTYLDSIVTSGNYRVVASDGPEYGHPHGSWGNVAFLRVDERGNYINQIYTYLDFGLQFKRSSSDAGASWSGWYPIGGNYQSNLTLYVSKSGSDKNPGLTADRPFLTIHKAILIAKALIPGNANATVTLRIGEGDWGDVTFRSIPFSLVIRPFDGSSPTEFSEFLPKFNHLVIHSSWVQVIGLVTDALTVEYSATCVVSSGYKRIGTIRARYFGNLLFASQDAATNVWEITAQSIYPGSIIYVSTFGRIDIIGYLHIRLVENVSSSTAFLCVGDCGTFFAYYNRTVFDSSEFTFTGAKCLLEVNSVVSSHELNRAMAFFTEVLPGSGTTIYNGAIVNGYIVGQAADDAVVHKTGDETIAGEKTFTSRMRLLANGPRIQFNDRRAKRGETPEAVIENAICMLTDSEGVRIAGLYSQVRTNGTTTSELIAYRNTVDTSTNAKVAVCYPLTGDPYATAPTTPAGSIDTQIVTADYLAGADSNVVHRTGDETIAGAKTWTGRQYIERAGGGYLDIQNGSFIKGTTDANVLVGILRFCSGDESAPVSSRVLGTLDCRFYTSSQTTQIRLLGYQNDAESSVTSSMGLIVPLTGNGYGYAPTPDAGANGTHIATTAWVRDRLTISTAAPSGGTDGDLWFQY